MNSHELTTLLVGGLVTVIGGIISIILSWLRDDIRNLAKAIASLRGEFSDFKVNYEQVHGILKGKGILT